MVLRIATAGWSYTDWEGVVHPRPKPPGFHGLRHLARFVDGVEINSSFYRSPRAEHAARWVECVRERPDFAFAAKLHRAFTHDRPSEASALDGEARAWREGVRPLAEAGRLHCVLAQLPHSAVATAREWSRLERIARGFGDLHLVVELRHESWFTEGALERLRTLGVSLACIDLPAARTHPPEDFAAVGEIAYLRLHGRNAATWFDPRAGRDARYDWLYSDGEVAAIVERARRLASERAETWVVANNHFGGKALVNALEIKAALTGQAPPAPETLVRAYPRLAGKVRALPAPGGAPGQGELFP